MRSWLLALVAGVAGVPGCAGADAMTAQDPVQATVAVEPQPTLGVNPGETMAFEVHLAGMLAGEAQLAVGEIELAAPDQRVDQARARIGVAWLGREDRPVAGDGLAEPAFSGLRACERNAIFGAIPLRVRACAERCRETREQEAEEG